jgi:tetratricopeptide (TPR) repeat protein
VVTAIGMRALASRMAPGLLVALVVATLGGLAPAALAQTPPVAVRASLDRQRLQIGEQTTLSVEIEGTADSAPPDIGAVDGLAIRYLGPSTQFSVVQGRVSQSVTHRYLVAAGREGRFTIGPLAVQAGGATLRTEPLDVEVTAAGARDAAAPPSVPEGGPDLALAIELPEREVYLHERVPLTLTLYLGAVSVDEVQQPRLEGDAFAIEPFGKPVQGRQTVDGRPYRTVRFETSIVPLRAGTLAIGPAVEAMTLLVRRRHRDPMFDRFFGGDPFAERQPYELRSNAVELQVKRLPDAGRPEDFGGAVGRFQLEVAAEPRTLAASDPITVTMRIAGSGNLSGVAAPTIDAAGFKLYPPQSVKSADAPALRVFEQVLVPTSEEVRQIPMVRFAYFDPEREVYEVATAGPIGLMVQPSQRAAGVDGVPSAGAQGSAANRSSAEPLGRDIVYIKDRPGRLRRGAPLHQHPLFLALQLIPLAFYVVAVGAARRRDRLHGDPRYARFARAGPRVRRAIASARRRATEGGTAEASGMLAGAMREYLSAKLDVPVGAIDAQRVAETLGDRDASAVARIAEFFAIVERVSYAPAAGRDGQDGDIRALLDLANGIVRDLERSRRLPRPAGASGAVAIAGMIATAQLAAAPAAEVADVDPVSAFFEANSLYKGGDYSGAVARYEAMRTAGFASGALYFNLGNAYLKAGDVGRAVLSYERAQRLLPRDADVAANLGFARERIGDPASAAPATPPLWVRLLVPLAFRAATAELAVAASAAYAVVMLLLGLRVLLPRSRVGLGRGAMAAGMMFALTGSACLYRVYDEALRPHAVVVAKGGVTVRFEPSDGGTAHFTLPEGALVEVISEREAWEQVVRSDGRRGWVAAETVETL